MKVTVIPVVISAFDTVIQRIGSGTGGLGNKRMSRDHSNFSIIKIGQNTKKSPGDLKKFAVSQTSFRHHQLIKRVK